MIRPGDVIDYYYLWCREADGGEESGRKPRPVCLAVVSQQDPAKLFLFPITSQEPGPDREAMAISEIECKRVSLRFPCWLILDEYNATIAQNAADFAGLRPRGAFSSATLKTVLLRIAELQASAGIRGVSRK